VLACDLGGSGLRAGLVDEGGRLVAIFRLPIPAAHEYAGRAEAEPDDWWRALAAAADSLAAAQPKAFATIEAVAITAFTRSQVLVDADGRPVRPALLWRDARAEALALTLRQRAPDHPEAKDLSGFHPLARLAWLASHEPASLARTSCVLEPKDYLNLRLTGRAVSDCVSLARLAAAATRGPDGRSLADIAGVGTRLLPQLLSPLGIAGTVQAGLGGALGRLAGRPVLAMANDTWTAVVGLGAMRAGHAYNISGTTEVHGLVTGRPATADGLLTVDWGGGLTQIGGPSQCGGDTLVWLLELVGAAGGAPEAALDALLSRPRDGQPLLFIPYLQGERVPHWDPSLRGAFIGLNRRHGPQDLAAAALEGIAFLNRAVLEAAETASGIRASEIRIGGGGSRSHTWCEMKASILGRDVVVPDGEEPGLLGAAICAATAIGRFPDLEAAQQELVRVSRRHAPDLRRKVIYDRLYDLFRQAEPAVAPLSRALAGVGSPGVLGP
jgi:xylulokinase